MIQYLFQDTSLSFEERAKDLVSHLTIEEKVIQLTPRMQAVPRLNIKEVKIGAEIARGLVMRGPTQYTTILPQPYGMAGMFDDDLMEKLGEMAGNEARIYNSKSEPAGSIYLLGPTVDMERDPRWGRNEEAYGEDPYLAAKMNIAYTKGLAGSHPKYWRTIPLLKHFYANNYENERKTTNANITPRLKQEYYLKVFRDIIKKGHARGLMTAYNCINGVEGVNNPIVWDECKKNWGMDIAVSDGGDFLQNVTEHRTFHTHEESIADILGKGADLMLDDIHIVAPAALEALKKGLMTEEALDKAVYSAFLIRFRTGEFDPPEGNPYTKLDESLLNSEASRELAEKAGRESMVLLKNNGLLPLKDDGKVTLAIVGPLSVDNYRCWYCGFAPDPINVVEGFRRKLGTDRVMLDEGYDHVAIRSKATGKYLSVKEDGSCVADSGEIGDSELFEVNDWDFGVWSLRSVKTGKYISEVSHNAIDVSMDCTADEVYGWFTLEKLNAEAFEGDILLKTWQNTDILVDKVGKLITSQPSKMSDTKRFSVEVISKGTDRVARLAEKADYVLAVGGNHPMLIAREEDDRPDIRLPQAQSAILQAAAAVNQNTILYIISGYPYSIVQEEKVAAAVLFSTHIGPSLGKVAADTVFGSNNPAGRCPTTWYRTVRDLPRLDDYDIMKNGTTYLYYKGNPLYPFGYGLSYTSFAYRNLTVSKTSCKVDDTIEVSLEVQNTGKYDGDEVVQLYVQSPASVFVRPERELKDFCRVSLKAGESRTVSLSLVADDLSFYNTDAGKFTVEKGTYRILVGSSSRDILCEAEIFIDGDKISGKCAERKINALEAEDYAHVEFLTDRNDYKEYFLAEDFRSYAVYKNLLMKNYSSFEASLSAPTSEAELLIIDNKTGESLGTCLIPTTGSLSQFISCSCSVKPVEGLHDVRIQFTKTTSMKEFRFI